MDNVDKKDETSLFSTFMHPSTASHLDTEYNLLYALYTRSKHQHRSQPFIRRAEQVLRIVRLLRDDFLQLALLRKVGQQASADSS